MTATPEATGQAAGADPPAPLDIGLTIKNYLRVRDQKLVLDNAHRSRMAPYNEALSTLEGVLMGALQASNQRSAATEHGTAFFSTQTSATVRDWKLTLDYIREHDLWDLLEARVSKTAAVAVVEGSGQPIPGVHIRQEATINIRRPKETP